MIFHKFIAKTTFDHERGNLRITNMKKQNIFGMNQGLLKKVLTDLPVSFQGSS